MPFFKALRDEFTGDNKKFISKDKIYQIVAFDFEGDGYEFAIIDDLNEELWVSDQGEFSYKNTFHKVKLLKLHYENGKITTS